ncbi:MAG: hypothetical protein RLZZ117_4 [Cyanobacteriota bacterium]
MARRHWLDPLARRLLIATGHLPPDTAQPAPAASPASAPGGALPRDAEQEAEVSHHAAEVERELEALKRSLGAGLVDVNRATASAWRQLPGCTAEQADLLVRLQAGGVQLSGPDDLRRLLQLDADTLDAWLPRLVFHWYGEPAPLVPRPVAVNRAGAAELRERLDLCSQRLSRLQRERLRAPFKDLADLQQRLQLPAAVVEAWIGRVSFEAPEVAQAPEVTVAPPTAPPVPPTAPGPSLPPTRRRSASHPGPSRRP